MNRTTAPSPRPGDVAGHQKPAPANRRTGAIRGKLYVAGARIAISVDDAQVVWDSGVCTQADPDLFFVEQGQYPVEALELCAKCPVRELCLETFGLIVTDGVVGGMTARERRRDQARRRLGGSAA